MRRFLSFLTFSYGTVFWNQPLQGIFFEARKWHYNWSPGLMTYALCSISRARPVSRALPAPRGRPGSLFGTFPFVFCLTQKTTKQQRPFKGAQTAVSSGVRGALARARLAQSGCAALGDGDMEGRSFSGRITGGGSWEP